jgi:hypothetical protein
VASTAVASTVTDAAAPPGGSRFDERELGEGEDRDQCDQSLAEPFHGHGLTPPVPRYIEGMPLVDRWGHPFRVVSAPMEYEIRSPGKDGIFEELPPHGATLDFDEDIVWRDGELVQWPQHFETQ